MPNLYALLVGINDYQAVTKLNGCVDDIRAVESLLRERVAGDALRLSVLLDAHATRDNIIAGFRQHLRLAEADDVALFYYCGHGSEEACPAPWRVLEPSGKNQTLVPVDARVGETFDLADKELNALIGEVAAGGGHVVMIFDSCHSGGVTREVSVVDGAPGVRMTAASTQRPRTLDDYLEAARTLYDPARLAKHGAPAPRHVAIAACQPFETAKEVPVEAPRRGAFTSAFIDAIQALGPTASYIDLVTAVRTKVRARVKEQLPNLHVAGGAAGAERFLSGRVGRRDLTVDCDPEGRWWLSAGAVSGVVAPKADDQVELEIYARGAFDGAGATPAPLATATVDRVLEDRSRLLVRSGADALETATQYLGVITRMGAPSLHVVLRAAPEGGDVAPVRARLEQSDLLFAVVDAAGSVPFVVVDVNGTQAQLLDEAGMPFAGLAPYPLTERGLDQLAHDCTHLADWFGIRDRSPVGSRYNERVRIELLPPEGADPIAIDARAAHPLQEGAVMLSYLGDAAPAVVFRLRNTAPQRLFAVLLDLDDSFGCSVLFADWIEASGTAFGFDGMEAQLSIPEWRDPSVRRATDYLKLFVATSQFDPSPLSLTPLLGPDRVAVRAVVRPTSDAFWGTSRLKVVTSR